MSQRIDVFNILYPDRHSGFETLFFEELDSWFSADIACCDNCYDQFVKTWPGTYLHDLDFQRQCISLDCFYEGSRLVDVFSKEEFWDDLKRVRCPNCGSTLSGTIWPYNFKNNLPPEFEKHLHDIEELSQRTPFLLLKNPFASKVHEEIKRVAATIEKEDLPVLYRGIPVDNLVNPEPDQFGPPPAALVKEGRYNHAGKPVLYLGSSPQTVSFELGLPTSKIHVAEVDILMPLKLLCFEYERIENEILNALVASSLLSSDKKGEGWDNSQYIFSRFVADCAVDAGFNGIRYPSVRTGRGFNVVLLDIGNETATVYGVKRLWKPRGDDL